MQVLIDGLCKDGLQTRVALDEKTVADYAQAMRDGDTFPPVQVYEDRNGVMWLADGFHRVEAALRCAYKYIEAHTEPGEFIDALRWALGCNAKHGKRVTTEDKQNAMQMAWDNRQDLFGGDPSAGLLASTCGVHRNTAAAFVAEHIKQQVAVVAPVRRQMSPIVPTQGTQIVYPAAPVRPVRTVVGTDGKSYAVQRPQRPAVSPAHVVPVDCYGVEIPTHLQAAFDGVEILRGVLTDISSARCAIRNGGIEMQAVRQDALLMLDNAYNFVAAAKAHCVCRMCQGHGCKACHVRGWQTEEEYERNPEEFKVRW